MPKTFCYEIPTDLRSKAPGIPALFAQWSIPVSRAGVDRVICCHEELHSAAPSAAPQHAAALQPRQRPGRARGCRRATVGEGARANGCGAWPPPGACSASVLVFDVSGGAVLECVAAGVPGLPRERRLARRQPRHCRLHLQTW